MNRYSIIFFLLLFSLTSNCFIAIASFDPKLKDVEFLQDVISSKTIAVSFIQKNVVNRHKRGTQSISSQTGKTILEVCKESHLFKEVYSDNEIADIKLHIETELNATFIPILTLITAVTLSIIPSYNMEEYNITYSFFDTKGKLIKLYNRKARVTQLFHILFFPFIFSRYNNLSSRNFFFEDVTKSVLDEANKDGLFK